jgi:Sec-independent protein translocase protein TatA
MFAAFAIGMTEIVVLLVIALLLFGKRFPDVVRSIARTVLDVRKEVTSLKDDLHRPFK